MRTLSGVTRRRSKVSLTFSVQPEVMILDEPTAGLDPVSAEILKTKILSEKAKGKLFIITSHVLSELDELVTHVMFMQDIQIISTGPFRIYGEIRGNKIIKSCCQHHVE